MTLQDFCYLGNPITETVQGADIERTVVDRNGVTVATLKAKQYNGEAQVDYAAVLRSIQESDGFDTLAPECLYTGKAYALQVIASIAGTSYIFVRGVSQKANVKAEAFKLLTSMPMLRHYAGYPLTLSYVINNNARTYWALQINGEHFEDNSALVAMANIFKVHATSKLDINPNTTTQVTAIYTHDDTYYYAGYFPEHDPDYPYKWVHDNQYNMWTANRNPQAGDNMYTDQGYSWEIDSIDTETDNKPMEGELSLMNGGVKQDSIQVKEMPVPVHPFYIRWVNTLGGFDYFMFACNQKQMKTLSENDSYERYITSGRYGMRSNYNKAATHTIEVSTGVIDRDTLESVAELIFSPLIQVYDPDAQSWIEIQVKDGKPELMANQPTGEMLITFELPTPQMNK